MKKIKLLCVDLQKDFATEGGKHYYPHANVAFIKDKIVPFCVEHKIKIAEIVSDYRQPRPGDRGESCIPGTVGYESELSDEAKNKLIWVKCMNSPIWTRENIGLSGKKPGLPYEDTKAFGEWLKKVIGPKEENEIVIMGLTIDCCCLCTTQELRMRGYKVYVIKEGVDTYNQKDKVEVLNGPILKNWGEVINWSELQNRLL